MRRTRGNPPTTVQYSISSLSARLSVLVEIGRGHKYSKVISGDADARDYRGYRRLSPHDPLADSEHQTGSYGEILQSRISIPMPINGFPPELLLSSQIEPYVLVTCLFFFLNLLPIHHHVTLVLRQRAQHRTAGICTRPSLGSKFSTQNGFLELGPQKILGIERDLSEILQAIRVIRNTYIPVNRLPAEILSRVLEYRTREGDLIAATHVCRFWRSVLVSSPSLWGCFRFKSSYDVDRTLMYLERSKSASIDVRLNTNSSRELEVLQYLTPHISRTRSFTIEGTSGVHAAAFILFCNPFPSLEHLEIPSREGSVRLPDSFLGQQAPSLCTVSFRGICPTFESPFPFPNLTEFHLHLPGDSSPFRMSSLFRFFSGCSRLQNICINISSKMLQDNSLDHVISLESLVELDYTYNTAGRISPT
ncbi:hypothetical protein BDM02DRAFT_2481269 [Thelephora ganbajun]|uniref:Uncharacterized protein n=1 Tax=Thelephora ganbajun TaxID=370292 RepID=A0ACB6ZEH4_THEGA|nr:hypothetical protein BDM02DRAFT_2481269 [Thelephora ganbajun]